MIWRFGCTAGSGDRGRSRLSARVSSRSVCASQLPPVSPLWALLGHGMNSNLGAVYASASCTSKHVKHDLNQHSTTHGCKSGHNSSTSMLIALSHDRPDSKSYIRTVRRPQVGSYIKGDEGLVSKATTRLVPIHVDQWDVPIDTKQLPCLLLQSPMAAHIHW